MFRFGEPAIHFEIHHKHVMLCENRNGFRVSRPSMFHTGKDVVDLRFDLASGKSD